MSTTNTKNLAERQAEIPDLVTACEQIADALSCAGDCETPSDFDANLDDAIEAAEQFLKMARAVRS